MDAQDIEALAIKGYWSLPLMSRVLSFALNARGIIEALRLD